MSGNGRSGLRPAQVSVAKVVLTLVVAGCAMPSDQPAASLSPQLAAATSTGLTGFNLTSSAFGDGEAIPLRYACDGDELSPPLAWSGAPPDTGSYALTMEDPDAGGFVHWVVLNMSAQEGGLAEGASGFLVPPAAEGLNGRGTVGYAGPCPPSGTHRYVITLYSLENTLPVIVQPPDLTVTLLHELIDRLVTGEAKLTGTYSR